MVKRVSIQGRNVQPSQNDDRIRQKELEDAQPLEGVHESGFVVREQLSTLITTRRSPPPLKLRKPMSGAGADVSGELSIEALESLSGVRNDVLAFYVSELCLRLNKLDREKLSQSQIRGIATVNQVARMFEHLHILRTSQFTE